MGPEVETGWAELATGVTFGAAVGCGGAGGVAVGAALGTAVTAGSGFMPAPPQGSRGAAASRT
jgi:hypothetical protein